MRNYQAIPPTSSGVWTDKASQIESGSSIGAADRCAGRARGCDRQAQLSQDKQERNRT
ncbi:hypothetical protein [Microcoleus sp.]|uniref:hypothetical protein n=1 Tax=Microcoleus sp. TaxID=44472 RepID=UPI00403EB8DC